MTNSMPNLALLAKSGVHFLLNRGPGCKSQSGTVGYYSLGFSARLKTTFELNPTTEGNQGTELYLLSNLLSLEQFQYPTPPCRTYDLT